MSCICGLSIAGTSCHKVVKCVVTVRAEQRQCDNYDKVCGDGGNGFVVGGSGCWDERTDQRVSCGVWKQNYLFMCTTSGFESSDDVKGVILW